MMNEKIDSREVYGDDGLRIDCDCNMERACAECIDGELYGTITTTQQGQMPEPPPFILLDTPWNEEDERAMHALTHCEDERACRFCNPQSNPSEHQVDGPKSCNEYYNACSCVACSNRDRWYANLAT